LRYTRRLEVKNLEKRTLSPKKIQIFSSASTDPCQKESDYAAHDAACGAIIQRKTDFCAGMPQLIL